MKTFFCKRCWQSRCDNWLLKRSRRGFLSAQSRAHLEDGQIANRIEHGDINGPCLRTFSHLPWIARFQNVRAQPALSLAPTDHAKAGEETVSCYCKLFRAESDSTCALSRYSRGHKTRKSSTRSARIVTILLAPSKSCNGIENRLWPHCHLISYI